MQCIIQKDGQSWSYSSGATYKAWYNGSVHPWYKPYYEAICAGRGDSNIQKDFLKGCASYVLLCDQTKRGVHKMLCVVESLEQYKKQICNGRHVTLVASPGNWSYRGYKGSITAVDAGQNGACFAMCSLSDTYYSEYLETIQ